MDRPFQLVFRFSEDTLGSFDFEDAIAEALGNPLDDDGCPHLVDGNEYGSGTIEIFVLTNDPVAAFELSKPLLVELQLLEKVVVAFCDCRHDDRKYVVVWPVGHTDRFAL